MQHSSEKFLVQNMSPLEFPQRYFPYFEDTLEHQMESVLAREADSTRESDKTDEQILTKLLENHPDIDESIGLGEEDDPLLEYIVRVPSRYSKSYYRESRSVDPTDMSASEIGNILEKEKTGMNSLKTDNDQDLLLIQNIGNGLIADLEGRLNKIRVKRQRNKQEKMWQR